MKLFDLVGGRVVIHNDALGIPCFKQIWNAYKDKELASNIISYIVLNNHPDSPYVTSMYESDRSDKLKKELLPDNFQFTEAIEYAEETYREFMDTLSLKLLRGLRGSIESISRYLSESKFDGMDMKRVKDIMSVASMADKSIRAISALEKQVRKDELETSTVRGGSEIGHFEIPSKR